MKQGFRSANFYILALAGFTMSFATVAMTVNMVPILTSKASGIAGIAGRTCDGFEIENHLRLAAHDERIDAVVVQFATPGGTVPGAQAIGDGILHVRVRGKPVVAHIDGLSASGGVYAMVAADQIMASVGSIIGSIGVTLGTHHVYTDVTAIRHGFGAGIEAKSPISTRSYTAGMGKDILSPWREPSPAEEASIRALLDDSYDLFVRRVAKFRHIPPEKIRDELGALIFSESEAKRLNLIDSIGNRHHAVMTAIEIGRASCRERVSSPV